MQAHKEELGIQGVFAATSLKTGEDWRWQTHLMNIPVTLEFKKNGVDLTGDGYKKIDFIYSDNFKNIFDLYINNSTTDKKQLGTLDVTSSMAEFAMGKCAMVQNGNWGASQILGVAGNTVNKEDIKFMPIYMGIEGEDKLGICVGTENFICINSKGEIPRDIGHVALVHPADDLLCKRVVGGLVLAEGVKRGDEAKLLGDEFFALVGAEKPIEEIRGGLLLRLARL